MNRKLFDQPFAIYFDGVGLKSKHKILDSGHISRSQRLTRKAKGKSSNARPKLLPHKNHNDAYCITCANYINRLQAWRENNG